MKNQFYNISKVKVNNNNIKMNNKLTFSLGNNSKLSNLSLLILIAKSQIECFICVDIHVSFSLKFLPLIKNILKRNK